MDWSSLILSGRQWETLDREDIGHAAVKTPLTCWSHSSLNAEKEEGADSPSSKAAWTQHPALSVISSGYKQKLCSTSCHPRDQEASSPSKLKTMLRNLLFPTEARMQFQRAHRIVPLTSQARLNSTWNRPLRNCETVSSLYSNFSFETWPK